MNLARRAGGGGEQEQRAISLLHCEFAKQLRDEVQEAAVSVSLPLMQIKVGGQKF